MTNSLVEFEHAGFQVLPVVIQRIIPLVSHAAQTCGFNNPTIPVLNSPIYEKPRKSPQAIIGRLIALS